MSQEKSKAAVTAAPERKSGRAVFDDGRTVWEWQTATGVFERFVSDEQLSRLEASDLRVVEHPPQDVGCAIYGPLRQARKDPAGLQRVFLPRSAASARTESLGMLRQFWRRLVPST